MFEIRTRKGRIAGPFTREKLKRYANEKRLDPRCDIRKHDPNTEHPWRPCWKTKGLFPASVVEQCMIEAKSGAGSGSGLAPAPERPALEPENDNWAFALPQEEAIDYDALPQAQMGAVASISAPPAPKKSKRAKGAKRSGPKRRVAWDGIGGYIVAGGFVLHLIAAVIAALSDAAPAAEAAAPSGAMALGIGMLLVGGLIALVIYSVFFGLMYRLGFAIIRVPSPGMGELMGTGFWVTSYGLVLVIVSAVALRITGVDQQSGVALMLAVTQLIAGLVSPVAILMMRHALDPLRAIAIHILSVILGVIIGFGLLVVLGAVLAGLGAAASA